MKKILNWTIGSMFRTIGRFIGLLLISCLFGFMLIKSGIKITDIFNLDIIKADTTYSWTNKQSRIYYDNSGTESVYDWHNIPYTHSANYPITKMQYRLSYSGGLDTGNTYTFTISYTPNPDAINVSGLSFSDSTGAITGVNCSGWSRNSSGKYSNTCAINPTRNISSSAYLYVMITYNEAYLTTLKSEVGNFSITKGVGAVIQDSAIDIMNNNNDNTNSVINNQNQNTQDIINNQNANNQQLIDNQNNLMGTECGNLISSQAGNSSYNDGNITITRNDDGTYTINGTNGSNTWWYRIQDNIILPAGTYTMSSGNINSNNGTAMFVDDNFNFSREKVSTKTFTSSTTIAPYIRVNPNATFNNFVIKPMISKGTNTNYCKKGTFLSKLDETTNSINNLNDSLNDSDTSSASSDALDFFNNFNDNSHGLTSIITTPLNTIRLMLSDTCVAPHTIYKGKTISLPCGSILWSRPGANALKNFLNLVYGGLLSYYLIVNLLSLVNDFKNPDNDKIEVADL